MVIDSSYDPRNSRGYVDTNKKIEEKYNKLIKASKIVRKLLQDPPTGLLRLAESDDCLEEMKILLAEYDAMIDDDMYYDELAWSLITESRR
jgi:hypothetical protein